MKDNILLDKFELEEEFASLSTQMTTGSSLEEEEYGLCPFEFKVGRRSVRVWSSEQWNQGLLLRPRALCHGKGGVR